MENVSRKCNINLPISRERKAGFGAQARLWFGGEDTLLMETYALSVWGLPLRTSVSREVGGGNRAPKTSCLNPTTTYCILFLKQLRIFAQRNRKGRFLREEVERFEMQPSSGVDRPLWRGCLLHRCSTIHIPSHAFLLFFLGDSQSVTVPGRKQLTSGTEFLLFYFSITQNRSCSVSPGIKT